MPTTIRPDSDIACTLSRSSGLNNYALVNESVLDPTGYVYKESLGSGGPAVTGSDLYSMGSYTISNPVVKITANFYLSESYAGVATWIIKMYTGASELATLTTTSTGWQTITYTGVLTQTQLNDLRLYVYISTSDYTVIAYDYKGNPYTTYYINNAKCCMCDADVYEGIGATFTLGGCIRGTLTKTFSLGGYVSTGKGKSFTLGGYIRGGLTKTFLLGGRIGGEISSYFAYAWKHNIVRTYASSHRIILSLAKSHRNIKTYCGDNE